MNATIRVIAKPNILWDAIEDLLLSAGQTWRQTEDATDVEKLVEFSGRICYMSFGERQSPRTNHQYLRNLIDQGHESVLEHAFWTFEFSQVSRAFTHQLVRHRIGFSYSQLSQQYVDHTDFEMLPPMDLSRWPSVAEAWNKADEAIRNAYRELRNAASMSLTRESFSSERERQRFIHSIARQILPNAVSTRMVVTANARSLRHFLRLRGGIEGDAEMRDVSVKLLNILRGEAPALFEDFEVENMSDGTRRVVTKLPG